MKQFQVITILLIFCLGFCDKQNAKKDFEKSSQEKYPILNKVLTQIYDTVLAYKGDPSEGQRLIKEIVDKNKDSIKQEKGAFEIAFNNNLENFNKSNQQNKDKMNVFVEAMRMELPIYLKLKELEEIDEYKSIMKAINEEILRLFK